MFTVKSFIYLPDGMPVEWRVSNQTFSTMNDIRYVIFRRIKQVWPSPIGKKFTKDPPLRRPSPPPQ